MRKIMVLNTKGGCGKSTITTNLASYYATQGRSVVVADFDPQGSSLDWLKARAEDDPAVGVVDASREGAKIPRATEVVLFDVPAGLSGKDLTAMVRRAETLIIPVLPSPIDIRACTRFIHDLLLVGKVSRKQVKLAVVANRVKEHTAVYHELERFLTSLKIPFITHFRDSMNYIRAAEQGVSIFELPHSLVEKDLAQWEPLVKWLNSKRSLPRV